jgi:GR25 family glycosyltransferase involved in LPS biosynthesis
MNNNTDISIIFYINLDRRCDRDNNVRSELNKHNLLSITERIRAVDGSQLNLNTISHNIITEQGITDAKHKNMKPGISMTLGAIGCAMSHRFAWMRINTDPLINSALILEDDIQLDDQFNQKLAHIQNYAKHRNFDYDVLFIGYHPATLKYIDKSYVNEMFVKSSQIYGLFGYIVTKKGAEKLLRVFPVTEQIDTELYKSMHKLNINVLLVKPDMRIVTSEPSEIATRYGSDIQTTTQIQTILRKEMFPSDSIMTDILHIVIITCLAILIMLLFKTCIDPVTIM